MSSFTFSVATMGCKANLTDSQDLESRLRSIGGIATLDTDSADVYVLNTCTVTDQADRDAVRLLKNIRAPLVLATGCLAEVDPERLRSVRPDLKVLRNSAKNEVGEAIQSWLASEASSLRQGDRVAWHKKVDHVVNSALTAQSEARTRAFLKVQDGCNAFCSYCIIPHARGRSRSVTKAKIIAEVNSLVAEGVQEVVLTAIHAADYEAEGLSFTDLVEAVLRETSVPRLRLTSLDPAEIPEKLLQLMEAEPRLCAHFHVSLQAASSKVLKSMKRAYGAEKAEKCLGEIATRLPHAFVGMDMIAGFPGETDADFEETYALLERAPWTRLHVFPYSVRRSTAAEKMVKDGLAVSPEKIKARAARLRSLSDMRLKQKLQERVGKIVEVLVEAKTWKKDGQEYSLGHARNYFKVALPGRHAANQLVRARIEGLVNQEVLLGQMV